MREARGRFDIAVIEGKVYAVGGCNGTTELATAEVYSSDNSKWTALPPLELARSNVGKWHAITPQAVGSTTNLAILQLFVISLEKCMLLVVGMDSVA